MRTQDHIKPGVLPLFLTMLWIAGMPIFLLFGNRLLAAAPALKADRLAFLLAAGSLAITTMRRSQWRQPAGRVEKAMVVYLAVILVSWGTTLPSKDVTAFKQDADFLLTCFVMPFAAFLIARNTEWTAERLTVCLWVLVAGVGTYLLLFGAAQYTYDWNFLVPEALKEIHPDRAKGPFENAVPYGVVLSMLVPLALFLYLRTHNKWARSTLAVVAIGLVQSIVACKTRAVWMALPVALLLPAIRYPRIRPLAGLLTLQLAVQVLLAPAVGFDQLGLRQRLTQPEPVYDRVAVSATASNMIEHRPLWGFGFGFLTFNEDKSGYYTSWGDISARWAVYPNNPHNDFLNVLVMMGVVGLLPYVALLWTSWLLLRKSRVRWQPSNPLDPDLATFVQALFLVLIIAGQFHSVMHMSYAQVLFFFLLGIAGRGLAETAQATDGHRLIETATASAGLLRPAEASTIATGDAR